MRSVSHGVHEEAELGQVVVERAGRADQWLVDGDGWVLWVDGEDH